MPELLASTMPACKLTGGLPPVCEKWGVQNASKPKRANGSLSAGGNRSKMSATLDMSASKLAPCALGGVKFGSYLNCLIEVWESNGTTDYVQVIRKLDDMVPALSENYPEGIAFVVIVGPGVPLPNSADRKALEAFFGRWDSKWRAIARVAEGSDMWSIATRAIMTALVLVKRANRPENTFSTGEEAAEWLGQFLTRRQGQDNKQAILELTKAIEKVRSLSH